MNHPDPALAGAALDAASTVVARETAQLKLALEMAQGARRDHAKVQADVLAACSEPSFARTGFYTIQTDNGTEERPTVHLAREVARNWGHVRTGFSVLANAPGYIQIRGWAWDLASGAQFEVEEVVEKQVLRRDPKTGKSYRANLAHDEKAWRAAVKCAGAIAMRGALLEVLPRSILDAALARCVKTEQDEIERNRERTVASMVSAFAAIGVPRDHLALWLGKSVDAARPEEIVTLRGIYTAIKEGDTSIESVFKMGLEPEKPKPTEETKQERSEEPDPQPVVERAAAEVVTKPGEGDDAAFLEEGPEERKPVNQADAALAAILDPAADLR